MKRHETKTAEEKETARAADRTAGGNAKLDETEQTKPAELVRQAYKPWIGGLVVMLSLLVLNQLALFQLNAKINVLDDVATASLANARETASAAAWESEDAAGNAETTASLSDTTIWDAIRPTGVPEVYGDELLVSYDDPEGAIPALSRYDDYGSAPVYLSGETMERYVSIGSSIACEYCCGAKTLVTASGSPACGCAHSAAMRGLAKYLLFEHPNMSDVEVLGEVGKWKVLFFPGDSVKKTTALLGANVSLSYISISSNQYRGIKVSDSGAVSLPGQVGGC